MPTFKRLISIARPYAMKLVFVAVLTSAGALADLVEPWVYRAIIDDIAGVFVSRATGLWPEIVEELRGEPESEALPPPANSAVSHPALAPPESPGSAVQPPRLPQATAPRHHQRRASVPVQLKPPLPLRTVSTAARTLWLGVLVLLGAAILSRLFAAWADLLAARTTNQIEQNFILKLFRHVLRLPVSYFTQRPSGAVARQIDQSDQIAPLYTAVAQEVWSELFTAVAILTLGLGIGVQ